jgi:chromosome partitioning protein
VRRIALVNEKGGSCKTTLAVNTAAYFALKRGKKVLLLDLDPQGQVGKSLGFAVRELPVTILDLLLDPARNPQDAILQTRVPGLDVILSNKLLTDFPQEVAASDDRMTRLASIVDRVTGYDVVLIDSPPSLGLTTLNIMLAAREIVIPVSLTFLALDGCAEIVETVENVRANFGTDLEVVLVVPTLYRKTKLADQILERLHKYFGRRVAKTVIGFSVKIDEAQSVGKTIWEHAPSSHGAEMLEGMAIELERRRAKG